VSFRVSRVPIVCPVPGGPPALSMHACSVQLFSTCSPAAAASMWLHPISAKYLGYPPAPHPACPLCVHRQPINFALLSLQFVCVHGMHMHGRQREGRKRASPASSRLYFTYNRGAIRYLPLVCSLLHLLVAHFVFPVPSRLSLPVLMAALPFHN